MTSSGGDTRQMAREDEKVTKADSTSMEELPLKSSPYVNYTDLEDYKRKGYGTEGHFKVVDKTPGGGGGTEAPTISGSGLSEGQVKAAELSAINKVHTE